MLDPTDGLYHADPYWDAPATPLFAFGEGLSFTSFQYLSVSASRPKPETITVDVQLRNNGTLAGSEVVMVFVTAPLDNIVRYWKRLVGVAKVHLAPASKAQATTVSIDIALDDLVVFATSMPGSPGAGTRTLLRGKYLLSAGGSSSTDWAAKTSFVI